MLDENKEVEISVKDLEYTNKEEKTKLYKKLDRMRYEIKKEIDDLRTFQTDGHSNQSDQKDDRIEKMWKWINQVNDILSKGGVNSLFREKEEELNEILKK